MAEENGRISNSQFQILIIMFVIGTSILITPPLTAIQAKQDAWLSVLLGLGFGLILVWLYSILAGRYPNMTIAQYSEKILGKWLGKFVAFFFFIYLIILTSGLLRISGDLLTTHVLPETPIQAIETLLLLVVIMGVRLGLETFCKTAEMLFPYIIIFLFFLILFLLPEFKFENLQPFLENGLSPVLRGSIRTLGVPFLDIVIFLMISPYVNLQKKVKKSMLLSTLAGGIAVFVITTTSILVLSAQETSRFYYPTFVLAQKISIGDFIERIEIISGATIFISLFMKITICFYATVLSISQTLQLKNYKILTLPLGIIIVVLSIALYPNIVYFHFLLSKAWTPIMLIFGLFYPLLLLFVDMVKAKVSKNKNIQMNH
ncbi:GerAB/ArcD/ProY family transporter [Neobacillus sp. LXY-4]|uniref:GerAB/ArcD/ProY family transporter n=1 Tax=Neobacillus sp. LXY-4 TaxID=3379826 RepID=UPI003EE192B9